MNFYANFSFRKIRQFSKALNFGKNYYLVKVNLFPNINILNIIVSKKFYFIKILTIWKLKVFNLQHSKYVLKPLLKRYPI